jgi:hypothetical protein
VGNFLLQVCTPLSLVGYLYLQQGFMLLLVDTKFYSPPNPWQRAFAWNVKSICVI